MTKKTVIEHVWMDSDDLTGPITEVIKRLQSALAAGMDVIVYDYYDSWVYGRVREETDAEYADRVSREEEIAEQRRVANKKAAARKAEKERALYDKLRKKYGEPL